QLRRLRCRTPKAGAPTDAPTVHGFNARPKLEVEAPHQPSRSRRRGREEILSPSAEKTSLEGGMTPSVMIEPSLCDKCGTPLPPGTTSAQCPNCLLGLGLASAQISSAAD